MDRIRQVPDGGWTAPPDFPDPDDVPILGAALAAGAALFVIGDRALPALGGVEGLPIVDPRRACLRVRGVE